MIRRPLVSASRRNASIYRKGAALIGLDDDAEPELPFAELTVSDSAARIILGAR